MRTTLALSKENFPDSEEKVCAFCGRLFYSNNPRSLYCSDSCKTKAYMARKLNESEIEEHSNTNTTLPSNDLIKKEILLNDYEEQISDLEEKYRLSEARNQINETEYLLLTAILADCWFNKIYDGEKITLPFAEIEKNCRPLAEIIVKDVGECELCEHGFSTTNFTLKYIENSSKSFTVGEEKKHDYLLSKNN